MRAWSLPANTRCISGNSTPVLQDLAHFQNVTAHASSGIAAEVTLKVDPCTRRQLLPSWSGAFLDALAGRLHSPFADAHGIPIYSACIESRQPSPNPNNAGIDYRFTASFNQG